MIRNLLSLALVAGLAYGAYLTYDKFIAGSKPPAAPASKQTPAAEATPFTCPADIVAYDPAAPDKPIGKFLKGTEIRISPSMVSGMKTAVLVTPDGQTLQALCSEAEMSKASASATPQAPATRGELEQKLKIAQTDKGVKTKLGNAQTGIAVPEGDPNTIKMGQSRGKSMQETFKKINPDVPEPTAKGGGSPEQNIKQRAKDLQQMDSQQPPAQ